LVNCEDVQCDMRELCCRSVRVYMSADILDNPDTRNWMELHENVSVGEDENGAYMQFLTRCKNNTDDLRCSAYGERPQVCVKFVCNRMKRS